MKKLLTALLLGAAATTAALAQAWPAKPVTLLVPFPPGGSTDAIARLLGNKLQETLGGSFVVDNRGGAGGTIGTGMVKRAAPDGYTVLVSSLGPLVIGPHLLKNLQYDPTKDLDYITVAVQAPNVLVVPAASPHKSMADVLAYEKANPGKMSFGSSGNGSSDHITAELFWLQTGTSGCTGERWALVMLSARSLPALICGSAVLMFMKLASTWLPSRSVMTGPPPL